MPCSRGGVIKPCDWVWGQLEAVGSGFSKEAGCCMDGEQYREERRERGREA